MQFTCTCIPATDEAELCTLMTKVFCLGSVQLPYPGPLRPAAESEYFRGGDNLNNAVIACTYKRVVLDSCLR